MNHFGELPSMVIKRWSTVAFILGLSACGEDALVPDPSDRVLSLIEVSGDQQRGKAGHNLPQPFLVQVIDQAGQGVAAVRVDWIVESGEGAFAVIPIQPECPPPGATWTRTNQDGFAEMSFMPTWFGGSTVSATVAGAAGSPAMFTTDATDPGATVTLVDGDGQKGTAGEPLAEPLAVKVTDGEGNPVPNVSVNWSSSQAIGSLTGGCPWTANWNGTRTTTRTLPDGALIAGVQVGGSALIGFSPHALGVTNVLAEVPGLAVPATFTVETTRLLLRLTGDWFGMPVFEGPSSLFAVLNTLPVGTTVEIRNDIGDTARIMSRSIPSGAEPFDSGDLAPGDRFQFVAGVSGTWDFVDQVSGTQGRLRVQ